MQANVDPSKPVEEWPLEQLAGKLAQYCPLMQDIQGSTLQQQAKGGSGFENLRAFLRNRGEQAYFQRVGFRADGSSCSVPRQAGLLWRVRLPCMLCLGSHGVILKDVWFSSTCWVCLASCCRTWGAWAGYAQAAACLGYHTISITKAVR